jgi:YD repeat-containing protein
MMRMRVVLLPVLLALAGPALAAIDFEAMPKGCSWTTRYSDGQVLTETYLGRKGGKHKTEVREGKALVRQTTYTAEGRMVRKDWANGKWETFSPYSCFAEAGSCTYRYRNADGADFKVASKTVGQGKGFRVKAGPVGGNAYPDEYFETGSFGIMVKNKASNYSAQLIEMKNCDLDS